MNEDTKPTNLKETYFHLKDGYLKGCLLPTLTVVIAVVFCTLAARHYGIKGTIFDKSGDPPDQDLYIDAQRDFSDGNLDEASASAMKILAKQSKHAPANQLMARIELTRGNRKAALEYLRQSLEASLNREEVEKWIAGLEASQTH